LRRPALDPLPASTEKNTETALSQGGFFSRVGRKSGCSPKRTRTARRSASIDVSPSTGTGSGQRA
jgi:hypothetical protein